MSEAHFKARNLHQHLRPSSPALTVPSHHRSIDRSIEPGHPERTKATRAPHRPPSGQPGGVRCVAHFPPSRPAPVTQVDREGGPWTIGSRISRRPQLVPVRGAEGARRSKDATRRVDAGGGGEWSRWSACIVGGHPSGYVQLGVRGQRSTVVRCPRPRCTGSC